MKKLGLLPRLIIGIILGIVIGAFAPEIVVAILEFNILGDRHGLNIRFS